jgi:hypothetical protein
MAAKKKASPKLKLNQPIWVPKFRGKTSEANWKVEYEWEPIDPLRNRSATSGLKLKYLGSRLIMERRAKVWGYGLHWGPNFNPSRLFAQFDADREYDAGPSLGRCGLACGFLGGGVGGHKRPSFSEERELIEAAIARFPAEFKLPGLKPGQKARISKMASFVDDSGGLQLYTQVYFPDRDAWLDYARGTESELRSNMRPL